MSSRYVNETYGQKHNDRFAGPHFPVKNSDMKDNI